MGTLREQEVWPDVAIPPGEMLAEELEARGWSQSELARRMGRPVQAINEIIRGVKQIRAETALQLAEVLGTSAELWIRLEAHYQLTRARLAQRKQRQPAVMAAERQSRYGRAIVRAGASGSFMPPRRGAQTRPATRVRGGATRAAKPVRAAAAKKKR